MKHLIDKKKFVAEIKTHVMTANAETIELHWGTFKEILSKHIKDLPKKEKIDPIYPYEFEHGYNQCLKDCEDK